MLSLTDIWFWSILVIPMHCFFWAPYVLLDSFRKSQGIFRKQAGILLLAAFVPWVANVLFIVGVSPFSMIDPTPLAFAITGIVSFGVYPVFNWLNIIMPIAHDVILQSMSDGVIILDTQQRIIEFNPAAQNIIGHKKSEVIGQLYNQILPGQLGLLDLKRDMTETKACDLFRRGRRAALLRSEYHSNRYPVSC